MALESVCDFVGEQLAIYCGKDLGDLTMVTLNKYVDILDVSNARLDNII